MLKQEQPCGWCRKTSELIPMQQGGVCHTICPECGSSGPLVSMEEIRAAYEKMRNRIAALEADKKELNSYIHQMDCLTDKLGVRSCINPLEDLRRAVDFAVQQKERLEADNARLEKDMYKLQIDTIAAIGREFDRAEHAKAERDALHLKVSNLEGLVVTLTDTPPLVVAPAKCAGTK